MAMNFSDSQNRVAADSSAFLRDWETSQQARNHPSPPDRKWVVLAVCISIELSDIVLSSTGIRYTFDSLHGTVDPFGGITVVLNNGARIEDGQGTGTVEDDLTTRNYVWHWSIPLNIDDIAAVIIGGTEIPVNAE